MERAKSGSRARRIIVGLSLALVASAAVLLWPGGRSAAEPVPSPNGYDDMVKATALLSAHILDIRNLPEGEMRKEVEQNRAPLQLVRSALERECRVPVEYSANYNRKHAKRWVTPNKLGKAFQAEGWVAELDQRTNDAARCYLDAIRVGHEASRGGTLIDHLLGVGSESMGSSGLSKIVPALDASACRSAIETLESIENKRESPSETLRIERAWWRKEPLRVRIQYAFFEKSLDPVKQDHKRYLVNLNAEIVRQSQLRIDLAKRAYELENGHPPVGLNVLVPAYLKVLPQVQPPSTNASSGSRLNR